jgi:hypothetical protein
LQFSPATQSPQRPASSIPQTGLGVSPRSSRRLGGSRTRASHALGGSRTRASFAEVSFAAAISLELQYERRSLSADWDEAVGAHRAQGGGLARPEMARAWPAAMADRRRLPGCRPRVRGLPSSQALPYRQARLTRLAAVNSTGSLRSPRPVRQRARGMRDQSATTDMLLRPVSLQASNE